MCLVLALLLGLWKLPCPRSGEGGCCSIPALKIMAAKEKEPLCQELCRASPAGSQVSLRQPDDGELALSSGDRSDTGTGDWPGTQLE